MECPQREGRGGFLSAGERALALALALSAGRRKAGLGDRTLVRAPVEIQQRRPFESLAGAGDAPGQEAEFFHSRGDTGGRRIGYSPPLGRRRRRRRPGRLPGVETPPIRGQAHTGTRRQAPPERPASDPAAGPAAGEPDSGVDPAKNLRRQPALPGSGGAAGGARAPAGPGSPGCPGGIEPGPSAPLDRLSGNRTTRSGPGEAFVPGDGKPPEDRSAQRLAHALVGVGAGSLSGHCLPGGQLRESSLADPGHGASQIGGGAPHPAAVGRDLLAFTRGTEGGSGSAGGGFPPGVRQRYRVGPEASPVGAGAHPGLGEPGKRKPGHPSRPEVPAEPGG